MVNRKNVFVAATCVLITWAVASCDDPFEHSKCKTREVAESQSPDRKFRAVISEGFCKPDTQKVLSTDVDLWRSSDKQFESSDTILRLDGKHAIKAIWTDPTHLIIECAQVEEKQILSKREEWGPVTISYKF